jgi:hypothetical protein
MWGRRPPPGGGGGENSGYAGKIKQNGLGLAYSLCSYWSSDRESERRREIFFQRDQRDSNFESLKALPGNMIKNGNFPLEKFIQIGGNIFEYWGGSTLSEYHNIIQDKKITLFLSTLCLYTALLLV